MKTVSISDEAHKRLTCMLGEKMAKTGKPQTFSDIIDELGLPTKPNKEEPQMAQDG